MHDASKGLCEPSLPAQVALRKNISVGRGQAVLFDEYRYFCSITNDRALSADQVIGEARQRCNQENLIAQLKGGVRALHAPVNTLNANWAYMTMASLAWSIKAWCALLLPVSPRWAERHGEQRRRLLTMEFPTFRQAFVDIPCQIVKGARRRALACPGLEPGAVGPRRATTRASSGTSGTDHGAVGPPTGLPRPQRPAPSKRPARQTPAAPEWIGDVVAARCPNARCVSGRVSPREVGERGPR